MGLAWNYINPTPEERAIQEARKAAGAKTWYAIGYQTGLTMYHDDPADLAYGLEHYTDAATKQDAHYEAGIRDALRDRLDGRMP